MQLLVSGIYINGDDNLNIELVSPTGEPLPACSPGAHIDIRTPSGMLRQYSICFPQSVNQRQGADRYLICIRQQVTGRGGSRSLHSELRVRDIVEASEPRNLFPLPDNAEKYLLFSAGIGITPIIGMALELVNRGASVVWHHFEQNAGRVAFLQELTRAPLNNIVHLHLSSEGESFRTLHIDELDTPNPDTTIMACGPSGFLTHLASRIESSGWTAEQLHVEHFQAAYTPSTADENNTPFEVEIASSGQTFTIEANQTIAEVLNDNGVNVEISCGQGMCGTCVCGVLKGQPDHRDIILSPMEREANDVMTLCCSRAKTPLLVLDL
ncbi:Tetrachlorobenzoquinone reductase [Halomonadaceae bacterium LMG 33818]|uniref:PDR/VanB family oxidoreductase n=1 Tax=Cernens ardua TaxID=3402176 RepID=UPI003EDB8EE9